MSFLYCIINSVNHLLKIHNQCYFLAHQPTTWFNVCCSIKFTLELDKVLQLYIIYNRKLSHCIGHLSSHLSAKFSHPFKLSFSAKLIAKFPFERSEKRDEAHRKKALKLVVHERVKYIRKALMMSKGER
jgi:hypothetical protein